MSPPEDFRAISLCNVDASAFIPGRMITDNSIIAFADFHSLKIKKRKKKIYDYEIGYE